MEGQTMAELKHWVTAFIAEYAKNGGNGTQAYLTVRPKNNPNSAGVEASKLLSQPMVQSALDKEYARGGASRLAATDTLLVEAEEVRLLALKDKKLGNAIQSIDLKAKLNGVYQDTSDKGHGYLNLIKSISVTVNNNTVNVGTNTPKPVDKCEVIDVEASVNSELSESVEKKHA